jgi:hypothetical protein
MATFNSIKSIKEKLITKLTKEKVIFSENDNEGNPSCIGVFTNTENGSKYSLNFFSLLRESTAKVNDVKKEITYTMDINKFCKNIQEKLSINLI